MTQPAADDKNTRVGRVILAAGMDFGYISSPGGQDGAPYTITAAGTLESDEE